MSEIHTPEAGSSVPAMSIVGRTILPSASAAPPAAAASPTTVAGRLSGSQRLLKDLMPPDFSISLAAYVRGGTDRMLLHPPTERRQPMRGFDSTYVDIVDYIVRITHRIWEEKDVGYIYDTYRHNARVVDDSGLQYGRDKVVADTVQALSAFPDMRVYADEVIWAGDENTGFYTSHRCRIQGTNTGWSGFGAPTNRRSATWCIANCVSQDNEIFEEWLMYDHVSQIRQLGYDVIALAKQCADRRIRVPLPQGQSEPTRLQGQGKPRRLPTPAPDFDMADEVSRAHHYAWNWRNMTALDRLYDERLRFHGPSDRELNGLSAYKTWILGLIAMFPDLAMQLDEMYWMGNPKDGYLTALRWSAVGSHRGAGPYGPATGRQVRLWGLTQQRFLNGRIVEEWTLFNEFDVLQQILASDPLS